MAFTAPVLVQQRTAHNFMRDLDAEKDLYFKAGALKEFLLSWSATAVAARSDAGGAVGMGLRRRDQRPQSRRVLRALGSSSSSSSSSSKHEKKEKKTKQRRSGEEEVENTNDDRTSAALLPLPARLERLYVDLFERGYVGISDVHAAQLWLQALVDVDYPFPEPVK